MFKLKYDLPCRTSFQTAHEEIHMQVFHSIFAVSPRLKDKA